MPLEELWADTRVLTVIDQRGLKLEWERANFQRKPQGRDPRNWTVDYLVAWLWRSTVHVPDPTPIKRAATDRTPHHEPRVAAAAYEHDPWASRGLIPPISERDLARGNVL